MFLRVCGPNTFIPLAKVSKKQTSVSRSTAEAELVSLAHGVAKEGLPALDLWETILGRKLTVYLMEDNEAACRIVITGRNPNMMHASRTQRIDITWLNERFAERSFQFINCPTEFQAADILTKRCTDAKLWRRELMLMGIFEKGQLYKLGALYVCPAIRDAHQTEPLLPNITDTAVQPLTNHASPIAVAPANDIQSTAGAADSSRLRCATESAALVSLESTRDQTHSINNEFLDLVKKTPISNDLNTYVPLDPDGKYNRTLIEFCCGSDSLLGQRTKQSKGCRVIRITEDVDGSSAAAAYLSATGCVSGKALLFVSIPCIGGTGWQNINKLFPVVPPMSENVFAKCFHCSACAPT